MTCARCRLRSYLPPGDQRTGYSAATNTGATAATATLEPRRYRDRIGDRDRGVSSIDDDSTCVGDHHDISVETQENVLAPVVC